MDLPTDVLLRTTDHLGSMVDDMLTQRLVWTTAMPTESSLAPFMFEAGLDAGDEFEAAPFIAAHGYYRQAAAALRNALELMTHSAMFAVRRDKQGYQAWRSAKKEPKFGNSTDLLGKDRALATSDQRIGSPGLFGISPPGVLRSLYRHLSRYAHSQPGFSNTDLWRSNGPIFSGRVFTHFWADFCDTIAACYVLFKIGYPALVLPEVVHSIYPSTGGSWHKLGPATKTEFFPD
jgi:hypothetical protein